MNNTLPLDQLSDDQLSRYGDLIYAKTGIRVSPQKKTLLSNRLRRRLRVTNIAGYDRYLEHLQRLPAEHEEWDAFLQEVTTHESYLFRDQPQWDWVRRTFVPEMLAQAKAGQRLRSLRIWSAACSTGDEPFTMACCLAESLPEGEKWHVDILGTDIGIGALNHAKSAQFGTRSMRLVSDVVRRRYFTKSAGDVWTVQPALQKWVRFRQHNLLEPLKESGFDLILVKNVLIYFDAPSKVRVLQTVQRQMKPGGYLVSGPAEGVTDLLSGLERLQGWLHRKPAAAPTRKLGAHA